MDPHGGDECSGCDWEDFPHAFRWFPELGAPLEPGSSDELRGSGAATGAARSAA